MKRINEIRNTDLFSHWINIAYLPRWGVLLLDLLIALLAFIISYFIGNSVINPVGKEIGIPYFVNPFHSMLFYNG